MIELIKEEHIYAAFKEVCDVDRKDVDFNKSWTDHGIDELDIVAIVMWFEKELNISIDDDTAINYITEYHKPYDLPGLKHRVRDEKLTEILG